MSPRRLTVRSRLGLGYAAVILVSGAVLLGGAYLIVARASARHDDAVSTQVKQRLAERRARMFPAAAEPPRGVPFPGEQRAERRATVAAQRSALPAYRREIALNFLALLAAVTVVSLGVGRVLAARALRPVRDITRAAQGIGEEDLGRRLGAAGPDDELTELVRTLDGMLERMQAAVEAQSAFAAHASHELRTPLSVIRAEIDACLDRPDTAPEQWRRSAEAMRRNVGRSERLVQQLLLLARARARPAVTHRVDLAETAQSLLDDLPAERQVRCSLSEALTEGDPALLEAAVANLLENAVRYNVTAGAIELTSWTDRGQACLTVGNDGPPVDARDVERLFEPFVRGRHGDGLGTGIGLAIVHGIVRAHGGTVAAAARAHGGLDVTIRLPSTTCGGRCPGAGWPGIVGALATVLAALAIGGCGARDETRPVACRALGEPADRAPGGGRLAVASDPDGRFELDGEDSELYLLNADGSGRTRLTTARGNDFTPAWSPDGTQIAFRSNRDRAEPADPNHELYVICADGSHERRLTTTPDIQERSPAYSPDGRWLAFAGENRDHVLDLYLMRPDGTQRRNLTADLDCGAEYPSWSPDGTQIAFHCFAALGLEIYTIAVDGTHPRPVTQAAGEDSFPAWSPDGRTILFNRGSGDLYLIRPDGTRRTRLTRHPRIEAFPSWSPDGARIAFASDRGRREQSYQLYTMRSDGSAVRQITRGRASHVNPAWQPVPTAR